MSLVLRAVIGSLFLLILAAPSFFGCAGHQVDENDPVSLLKDAEEEIKSDHYQMALDKLRAIKNRFPYSSAAVDAQLRIADVYFLQESYAEAAGSYETFRDLHPKHEKLPYVMYRIGRSYLGDAPDLVERDLSPARKALDAFEDFVRRFPNAPEAAEAQKDIARVRQLLAEKEMYVGDFYYRRKFYESARPRYMKVIELYPNSMAATNAKARLAELDKLPRSNPKERPIYGK